MYFLMQCPYLLMQKIELLASMSTNRMFKISWLLRSLTVISLYYCRLTLSKLSKKTFYDPNWQFGKYKVDSWMYRYLKIKETKRRYCIVEYMCVKNYIELHHAENQAKSIMNFDIESYIFYIWKRIMISILYLYFHNSDVQFF